MFFDQTRETVLFYPYNCFTILRYVLFYVIVTTYVFSGKVYVDGRNLPRIKRNMYKRKNVNYSKVFFNFILSYTNCILSEKQPQSKILNFRTSGTTNVLYTNTVPLGVLTYFFSSNHTFPKILYTSLLY